MILKIIKVWTVHTNILQGDEKSISLIREMIFENYKTVHSIYKYFTEMKILISLIRGMILKIIKVCTVYTNILRR